MRLVMTFLLALETGDLLKGGLDTCSGHCDGGGIGSRNALVSLFIEQARNDEIEGERLHCPQSGLGQVRPNFADLEPRPQGPVR